MSYASSKVYVFNDNVHPIREIFKGEQMEIGAKSFWLNKDGSKKLMDVFEANEYAKQYRPVPCDMSGKMEESSKFYKMIRLIPETTEATKPNDAPIFRCMAKDCTHISPSAEELEAHTKVRHQNAEKLVMPEVEEALNRKKKAA